MTLLVGAFQNENKESFVSSEIHVDPTRFQFKVKMTISRNSSSAHPPSLFKVKNNNDNHNHFKLSMDYTAVVERVKL